MAPSQQEDGRTASINARIMALHDKAHEAGIRIHWAEKARLEGMVSGGNHQGVVAQVDEVSPQFVALDDLLQIHDTGALLIVALDQISDPHNLGACLRNADALGAQAVIVPKDRSVGLSATVSRVAVGAAENVPLIVVTNFARALSALAEAQVALAGLAGEGDTVLWDYVPSVRQAWVLGNEAEGLRRLTRERCDTLITIPMQGVVDSLNVSACTAVCLAHSASWRYRQSAAGST